MNERIREIEVKCWEPRKHPASQAAMGDKFNTVKFAELIVRECMNLVKDCYAEPQSRQSPYQTVCASTIIEDHFGVEE